MVSQADPHEVLRLDREARPILRRKDLGDHLAEWEHGLLGVRDSVFRRAAPGLARDNLVLERALELIANWGLVREHVPEAIAQAEQEVADA